MTRSTLLPPAAVRARKAAAWSECIANSEPTVLATLGTNRPLPEHVLMDRVRDAFRRLDSERNRRQSDPEKATKYPEKLAPHRRVHAFIAPEKIGLNAHVHVAVWHPVLLVRPRDSELAQKIARTRDEIDFLCIGRDEYVRNRGHCGRLPRLDAIWREVCPGGHYHARRFDSATMDEGSSYLVKELKWLDDKDIYLSADFWPEGQRNSNGGIRFSRTVQ